MSDNPSNNSDLAFMLGRIQGDLKHVLEALHKNDTRHHELERRVDKLEQFSVRVLTGVALTVPLLTAAVNYGVRALMGV